MPAGRHGDEQEAAGPKNPGEFEHGRPEEWYVFECLPRQDDVRAATPQWDLIRLLHHHVDIASRLDVDARDRARVVA
jgi:hypothetical protein